MEGDLKSRLQYFYGQARMKGILTVIYQTNQTGLDRLNPDSKITLILKTGKNGGALVLIFQ